MGAESKTVARQLKLAELQKFDITLLIDPERDNPSVLPLREVRLHYHSRWVRLSHGIQAASLLALLATGGLILLSYPRLHWGNFGSLQDSALSLPLHMTKAYLGSSRTIHFVAAWLLVINGVASLLAGLGSGRLQRMLLQSQAQGGLYSGLQRLVYAGLLLLVLPLIVLSGLTMAPSIVADYPSLLGVFNGASSARTVHFGLAVVILLFTVGHIMLALRSRQQLAGMTTRRLSVGAAQ